MQLWINRDFNQYIDREWVDGGLTYPNDPHATKAIADQKDRWMYRNVNSIFEPVDVQIKSGHKAHPLIDNHPINYPNDADATAAIAATDA